ncbi:MAG: putative 2OG-Fe(II) oxygenase [Pseudomonadota bacterium]
MGEPDDQTLNGPDRTQSTKTPETLLEEAYGARQEGDLATAAKALDGVLTAAPNHPLPLTLRARVALERCELDALARFDAALRVDPGNADLHLGKAQALEMAGDIKGARVVAEQIADQAPGFTAALSYLSGLYLAGDETDFTRPFQRAAQRAPTDPNIRAAWIDALAGIERFAMAADIAAIARSAFPNQPHFALLEAMHASASGAWQRAETIYADLGVESLQRWLMEARHRVRAGDIPAAQILLDKALQSWSFDIAAWALQGVVWRLAETPEARDRAGWLHEQAGLVQMLTLEAPDDLLPRARSRLVQLHKDAGTPLSQSVRGGSQTRGVLFHRSDPVLAELHTAILTTLATYKEGSPLADDSHPILRSRDEDWRLAGSWSVRLKAGGDYHAAHIHPSGLLSSALYVDIPETVRDGDQPGWLELGRPPADLGLDLDPLAILQPKEGHLALFPSTLYHGTRPFPATRDTKTRMTVAFDVITKSQQV